ncbi:MAG TPA: hypothetical protein VM286_02500 [Candidatus Thermoplasmatota archaeon]|nr:hypothetical protein [Candidatus Thermoplasmatota archaeon]
MPAIPSTSSPQGPGPGTPILAPRLEMRLAAVAHLSGVVTGPIGPLAAAMVWTPAASPWLRRHLRDASIHWAIVLGLSAVAVGLDAMNPVYDFGIVHSAFAPTLTRLYGPLAWGTSTVFAALSAGRALHGDGPLYPSTAWWSRPQATDVPAALPPVEFLPTSQVANPPAHPGGPPAAPSPPSPPAAFRHATDRGAESFADLIRKADLRPRQAGATEAGTRKSTPDPKPPATPGRTRRRRG